jgi:hypothetical protein
VRNFHLIRSFVLSDESLTQYTHFLRLDELGFVQIFGHFFQIIATIFVEPVNWAFGYLYVQPTRFLLSFLPTGTTIDLKKHGKYSLCVQIIWHTHIRE